MPTAAEAPRELVLRRARRVLATPRRGSSWPHLVETDDGRFFTKLRGAGQGTAALVAEVVVAALAEALGLRVPARVLVHVGETTASDSQDPEVLELLARSRGLNLGFAPLEGARDWGPADLERVDPGEAARIVWLDGLVMNADRSARNPNLMLARGRLWLIDHGAALGFQHDWRAVSETSPRRIRVRADHVLAGRATRLGEWDGLLAEALSRDVLETALASVPDGFLAPLLPRDAVPGALERRRAAYVAFLWKRLKAPRPFLEGAA